MDHFAAAEDKDTPKTQKLNIEEATDVILKQANRITRKSKPIESISISNAEEKIKDEIDELIAMYTSSKQGRNEPYGLVSGEVYESHSQRKKLMKKKVANQPLREPTS